MSKILAQGMITLTQLYEGAQVILTPAAVLIPCDSNETPKPNAYINAFTNVKAFLGTMDITSRITLGTLEYSDSTVRASKSGTKVSITAITTRTGYVDIPVSVAIDGETVNLGKHRFSFVKQIDGQTGQPGIQGAPGFSYTLNIKGGTRGIAYAANGTNPEPNTSSQFSVELLKNGVKVSNPASISWTCGGNLSGSSSAATFTPTIKSTYTSGSSYVKVSIKEFADSLAVEETIPVVCTKHADGLDWINEWNGKYVQVGTEKIITPKIFAGTKNSSNELTGVAIGRDVLGGNANKVIGIVGYKKNTPVFSLDQDANFFVSSSGNAGDIKNGTNNAKGIYFDGNNLYVSGKVKIGGGSTIGESNTLVEDVINNSNLGAQASDKLNNLSVGGRNLAQKTSNKYSTPFTNFDGGTNKSVTVARVLTDGLAVGDTVSVRLVYKYDNIVAAVDNTTTPATTKTATAWIQGSGNVTNWESGAFYSSPKKTLSGSGEHIFSYSFKITSHHLRNDYWSVRIRHDNVQSGSVQFKMFKVEKGSMPTDWTPAPEDAVETMNGTVKSVDVQYAINSSPKTAPTTGWQTNPPKWEDGKYIWSKTTTTYVGKDPVTTDPVCITGAIGATGNGIKSTTITYQVSTSGTTPPTGTWSSSVPTIPTGQYLWTKTETAYTGDTNTSTSYSVSRNGTDGNSGRGISATTITYAKSTSGTTAPSSGWQNTIPSVAEKEFLWTKTVITYTDNKNPTTSYSVSKMGAAAKSLSLSASRYVVSYNAEGTNPKDKTVITLTASRQHDTSTLKWSVSPSVTLTKPGTDDNVRTIEATALKNHNQITVTVKNNDETLVDMVTISKVLDGAKGNEGKPAYTIILTNESHTFPGTTSAAIAGTTTCSVLAYKGTEPIKSTINQITGEVTGNTNGLPTGMSVVNTNSSTATTPSQFTVTVTDKMTTKNGKLTVPVVVDGITFTKEFTFSLALSGVGVKKITNYYMISDKNSGITTSTSGWDTKIVSTTIDKKYLWNYEKIEYTNGSITSTTPCVIGTHGASGKSISAITEYYAINNSSTTAPTTWTQATSGTPVPSPTASNRFLWNYEEISYSDNSAATTTAKRVIGVYGNTGDAGRGITSITEEYYLSTSKTSQTGGSWKTSPDAWKPGYYMWTRSKITYDKGTPNPGYTEPLCDSSWEAVNEIEIGGANLAKTGSIAPYSTYGDTTVNDSDFITSGSATFSRKAVVNEGPTLDRYVLYQAGKEYVISFEVQVSSTAVNTIYIHNGCGHTETSVFLDGVKKGEFGTSLNYPTDKAWHRIELKFKGGTVDRGDGSKTNSNHTILQLLKSTATAFTGNIRYHKVEMGNQATAWTPSLQEIKDFIDGAYSGLGELEDALDKTNDLVAKRKEEIDNIVVEVDGNQRINGELLVDAITSNSIKAGSFTIQNASVGRDTFVINKDGDVKINGTLQSDVYSSTNNLGYRITPDGKAYFNQVTIKGDVQLPNAGITHFGGPIGNKNLISNTSASPKDFNTNQHYVNISGTKRIEDLGIVVGNKVTFRVHLAPNANLKMGAKARISCYTDVNDNTKYTTHFGNVIESGKTGYSTVTVTVPAGTYQMFFGINSNDTTITTGVQGKYKEAKAEIADSYTPWCPHEGDSVNFTRIWAGASYSNRDNAPFRVMQDGSLFATNGTFRGQLHGDYNNNYIHIHGDKIEINDAIVPIGMTMDEIQPFTTNTPHVSLGTESSVFNNNVIFNNNSVRYDKANKTFSINSSRFLVQNPKIGVEIQTATGWNNGVSLSTPLNTNTGEFVFTFRGTDTTDSTHRHTLFGIAKGGKGSTYGDLYLRRNSIEEPFDLMVNGNIHTKNAYKTTSNRIELRTTSDGWGFFMT